MGLTDKLAYLSCLIPGYGHAALLMKLIDLRDVKKHRKKALIVAKGG